MRTLVGLCAVLLASPTFAAATAPYIESFDVRVNNVDVIVTDSHGNHVTGLGRDDFEVRENGVLQPVSNFSEYRGESDVMSADASPAVSRKFVFVIDDMSMHPQVRQQLKASIANLISVAMREGDEAMIVRPESHERIALAFTSDRTTLLRRLDEVIDENTFRATTPINLERHALEQNAAGVMYGPVPANSVFAFANRVTTTIGHIQSIVSAMAEVPGKKTMVLVTEWLPAIQGWNGFTAENIKLTSYNTSSRRYDMRPLINAIAQTASSNGIAIYSLQPSSGLGLAITGPDASDAHGTQPTTDYQRFASNTETTMQMLADRTGASWSHDTSALFDHLQNDLATYYSIGYKPTAAASDKVRRIDVRVKGRRDLQVRTRRDVVQKSLTAEMNERVVGHLVYAKDVDELGATARIGTLRADRGTFVVPVTVEIPIANLTLLPDGDKYRGSFSVHYAAAGLGEFSSGVQREQVIEIPASKIADARTHSYTYTSDLRVLPGKLDIAVGVLDPISRLTTFKTISLDAR